VRRVEVVPESTAHGQVLHDERVLHGQQEVNLIQDLISAQRQVLRQLRRSGVEEVLVCPVGFVSDHLEIRWDIDVEAMELAADLGLELSRIEMPNDEPAFVAALAGIVRRTLQA